MPESRTPKRSCWRPIGALLIVLVAAALTGAPPTPTTAAEVPAVVSAASGSLTTGAPSPNAVFPITVTSVQKLGAASVLVGYDPASLKPVACQRGPAFDVGVCNRSYDRDGDGTADAVFFAVLSLNGVSATDAAVPLTNITWQAVAAVQDKEVTALTVEVRTFTNTDGVPMTYTTQDGQFTLLPPPRRTYLPFTLRAP
jgi:hypothetical protein